jgi:RsiW-degrading membrane proteinase PrsW (M82 family)
MLSKDKLISYCFALLNFVVGFGQRDFICNVTNPEMQLFVGRNKFFHHTYQFGDLLNGSDPRFYSMFLYAFLTFIFSIGFIYFYFKSNTYTKITLYIFIISYFVSIVVLVISYLLGYFNVGFELFQKIKNSLSSSFFLLFLLAMFIYDSKQKESTK